MTPNEWQEKVDITYTHLVENHLVFNAIQLEYIYREYCQLCKKVSEALSLLKVRQFLTELHFSAVPSFTNIGLCYWQQAAFPLSAHELYHEISKELTVLARDFFRESKGFLNDFTRYCGIILPEVECRGITFGSFGRCVKRCTTPKYFNELESNIQRVLEPFSRKGLYIDRTICFYRDKFVEHNDSLTYPELLTGPEQLQLVHPSPSNNNSFWVPTGHRAIEDEYKVRTAFIPPSDMLFLRGERNQL